MKDYMIVIKKDGQELVDEVNKLLKQGYLCLNGMSIHQGHSSVAYIYYQSLYRPISNE